MACFKKVSVEEVLEGAHELRSLPAGLIPCFSSSFFPLSLSLFLLLLAAHHLLFLSLCRCSGCRTFFDNGLQAGQDDGHDEPDDGSAFSSEGYYNSQIVGGCVSSRDVTNTHNVNLSIVYLKRRRKSLKNI